MWSLTSNHRFLSRNGKPFFYLADTAWELFHRLTLDEARRYLDVRAAQGFSVIQAVALAEFDGLKQANQSGDVPLIDLDPARPNEKYFAHVDTVLREAEKRGLVVAFLPTWGDKINKLWGVGPEVFTPENARVYGEWLGRRYARQENLVWVLGGDRVMETEIHKRIVRAMAEGLHAGDGGAHLRTFHPQGGRSSGQDLHAEPWLEFNLIQSGHHARNIDNVPYIDADRIRTPVKPTLESEANYENHPVNWKPDTGRFRAHDVRVSSYRSVFAGGAGITYGCQDVWQFFDPSRNPAIAFTDTPWPEAIHFEGAYQMRFLRELMESVRFETGEPAQDIFASEPDRSRAIRGNGYCFVYLPEGGSVALNRGGLGFAPRRARWLDPRTGVHYPASRPKPDPTISFVAPSAGRHDDWVLRIES